jgi:pyruvate,water dikinase
MYFNRLCVGSDAAYGKARVITDLGAISTMNPGEILVADMTDPDWVPAIRIASAGECRTCS